MTVGKKIQVIRLRAGLSQAQLAERLCVSRAAVAKWENDNGLPDISNLKALATFFQIDLNTLLDENQSICVDTKDTSAPSELAEIPESFCGKPCSTCEFREKTNCPGCREGDGRRYGACRLADCCYAHVYTSCKQCDQKPYCDKFCNIPKSQTEKMKERSEAKAKFQKQAPLMGRYLWILFWIGIVETIAGVLADDFVANWLPYVNLLGKVIVIGCGVCYAFIMLKLSVISEGYQIAGVCALTVELLDVFKLLFSSASGLSIVLTLVIAVLYLVAKYNECVAHAFALEGLAHDLCSNWQAFWKWFIIMRIGVFVSAIFGKLLMLIVLLAVCALGVYQLILLYRTAEFFENKR